MFRPEVWSSSGQCIAQKIKITVAVSLYG